MSAFKTDGIFTAAAVRGGPRRTFPIERDLTAFIIEQDYIQTYADYARLALNTAHPSVAAALLVSESALQNLGGGLVSWTRKFATVPAERSEYESFTYTFPKFMAESDADLGVGARDGVVRTVESRLDYKYFLTDDGGTYDDPADIPIIADFRVKLFGGGPWVYVDYVSNNTFAAFQTVPSRDDYEAMIEAGDWIVAEASRVHPWMGNIYERVTRYVRAE